LKRPLWYVADVPYLFWHPDELEPNVAGMTESSQSITEAGLKAWIEAVLAYQSQLSSLFESPDKMKEEFRSYWSEQGGLSLWKKNSPLVS
jgi:hypothetical protein